MIRNWWYEKKYAQIRLIKNMSKILKLHLSSWIYVRTSHRRNIYELRGTREEGKRFNYWIFTFFTQTWTIIQIHFLLFCFVFHIALHHHLGRDKIIIHRTSNGCKSFWVLRAPDPVCQWVCSNFTSSINCWFRKQNEELKQALLDETCKNHY